jgi:hypothetical protein
MMDAANSRVRLMARERNKTDQYTDEEARRRFEAALRGAREVGHEQMKDIPPKAGKKERPASKGRVHKGKSRT